MSRRGGPDLTMASFANLFRDLRSDYNAAKTSRYRRRRAGTTSSSSGDFHYRSDSDYLRMMELARDFERNDGLIPQGLTRVVDNVIQDGITPDPRTGDRGVDNELKARWAEWAQDADECDLAGEHNFLAQERLIFQRVLVDGDVIALPRVDGRLQLIEAHRVRTPSRTRQNVVHGVLLGEGRRRLEYWVTREDLDPHRPLSRVADVDRIPTRDPDGRRQVLHIYNPRRVTQTRGVTVMAPVADYVSMHDDIQFARLVQQQIVSCFAILRERESDGWQAGGSDQSGPQRTEVQSDGSSRTIEGVAPGMDVAGNPGEKLTGFSPNVPNPQFFDHVHLVLGVIAVNLGLPLQVLLLDATQTNFSGWRGALDQARLGFCRMQKWMVDRFHRPVYRWKVGQWIADDPALRAVADRVDLFGHRWQPPSWAYIEPLKDASADLLRVRNALISPRRLQAERGRDWEELATEIVEDNAFAIRAAKEAAASINEEFEDNPVHWRELISLPTPDGVTVSASGSESSSSPPEPVPQPSEEIEENAVQPRRLPAY